MYWLKYKNDKIGVNGLHFYGCSFTAGQELLDSEYVPQIRDAKDFATRMKLVEIHAQKELNLAWPRHLCNKLGIANVVNNARPGNGMDNMKSQFLNDIIHNRIPKDHGVMFGCTGYFRETRFHPLEEWHPYEEPENGIRPEVAGKSYCDIVVLSHGRKRRWARSGLDEDFAFKYLRLKHPYTFLYEYYNNLLHIVHIAEKYEIPIYFVACLEPLNYDFFLDYYVKKHPIMKDYEYEYLDNIKFISSEINKYIITDKSMADFSVRPMPKGHPNLEEHVMWADHLATKLKV